jgi:hypothetical protein
MSARLDGLIPREEERNLERGYDATGGEALIPLIPIIALVMVGLNRKSV